MAPDTQNTPSPSPQSRGPDGSKQEIREFTDVRSQLAALKLAVEKSVDVEIDTAARNFSEAFAKAKTKLFAMPQEQQREMVKSIVTQDDAVLIANLINKPHPHIRVALQGLSELQSQIGSQNPNAPAQPGTTPDVKFDINDPLASIKRMPFVEKIKNALVGKGIPADLFEQGLSMLVTMALSNYSKNPSIAGALIRMKSKGMREMSAKDNEVTRLLGVKRLTLDQAMAQWEATNINNLVDGKAEVTLRAMLEAPPAAPATTTATPPAEKPAAAPSTATATGPKEVEINKKTELTIGGEKVMLSRNDAGSILVEIGSKNTKFTVENLNVTKLIINEKDGEIEATAGDKTIKVKYADFIKIIKDAEKPDGKKVTVKDTRNVETKIELAIVS